MPENEIEDVASFIARFEAWAPEHLTRIGADPSEDPIRAAMQAQGKDPDDPIARAKTIQGTLYEADSPASPSRSTTEARVWMSSTCGPSAGLRRPMT